MTIPEQYRVEPPRFPEEDLSGVLGPRFLELLSNQMERNLEVMEDDRKKAGIEEPGAIVSEGPYFEYFVAGTAYAAGGSRSIRGAGKKRWGAWSGSNSSVVP